MQTQYTELTDSQWQYIEKIFPEQKICTLSLRQVLNGIFWLLRTGTQWRNLESKYPPYTAVYHHFRKWKNDGRLEQLNELLVEYERRRNKRERSPSLVSIDSQSVKIAPFSREEKGIDGGKKVNGRKRHIITDSTGLIMGVLVSAANYNDGKEGIKLFGKIKDKFYRLEKVLGDNSYRKSFEKYVKENSLAKVEISSKPPSEKGFVPIAIRWTVERTFGWLNFYRRLSKDYEKTASSAASWVLLANSKIILNRMQSF